MVDFQKIVQSLCYVGNQRKKRCIGKIDALKIIYLADRHHLRSYGSSITGDAYYAMKRGPVASRTKDVIEGKFGSDDHLSKYALQFITPGSDSFCAKAQKRFDCLAETDIVSLSVGYKKYVELGENQKNIVEYTHNFPEWRKHLSSLNAGRTRVKMSVADFFDSDKRSESVEYCTAKGEQVKLNREIYLDTPECLRA